jgi:hypothetical protein
MLSKTSTSHGTFSRTDIFGKAYGIRLHDAGYQPQTTNSSSSSNQVARRTTRSQPLRFDPAPQNARMECKQDAFSKKRKQTALKAIEANFNDPAIEKEILQKILWHANNKKENKPIALLLSLSRGGKSKTAIYEHKKTNTNIGKGLRVMLRWRSKIIPKT